MRSWLVSAAVALVVSIVLSYVFLRFRARKAGDPFSPHARWPAVTIILIIAFVSTGLGYGVAAAGHDALVIYAGLICPCALVLWAAYPQIRETPLLGQVTGLLTLPFRLLDEGMGDDLQYWCDVRVRAASRTPQWISDAAGYYLNQVVGRLKDPRARDQLTRWQESIRHKINIVRLISFDTPSSARLQAALLTHPSTANGQTYVADDPSRLSHRLEAEAQNELHLMLAYLYRLGYRRLLVYPFRPESSLDTEPAAEVPGSRGVRVSEVLSPVTTEGDHSVGPARDTTGGAGQEGRASWEVDHEGFLDGAVPHDPINPEAADFGPARVPVSGKLMISELNHSMQTPLSQISYAVANILRGGSIPEGSEDSDSLLRIRDSVEICWSFLGAFKQVTTIQDENKPASERLPDRLTTAAKVYLDRFSATSDLTVDVPDSVPGYSSDYVMGILLPLLENAVEASLPNEPITITYRFDAFLHHLYVKSHPMQLPENEEIYLEGYSTKSGEHQGLGLPTVKMLLFGYEEAYVRHQCVGKSVTFEVALPGARR